MKIKFVLLLLISIPFFGCSSDSGSSGFNAFFKFTLNGNTYDASKSISNPQLSLWGALLNQSSNQVDVLTSFTSPYDGEQYTGASFQNIPNEIGTYTNISFSLMNGNELISCSNTEVHITAVGNSFEGTFSGNFTITNTSPFSSSERSGSGSFKVPVKIQ
jgi:hypothetical protein